MKKKISEEKGSVIKLLMQEFNLLTAWYNKGLRLEGNG